MSIEVQNVTKSFGTFKALDNVSIEIKTGELVALLGPSGSGKTTLLRIIAGLEQADPGGRINFWGEDVADYHVSARKVGFVFQHYALFKHMTVFENVAFGLRARPWRLRPRRSEIADRVHSLLKLVQLDTLAKRYPSQLSGGQRQRVALARALAVEPKVLLLDEPFGALDARVRRELRRWLRRLHDEVHITSVFVTHDQEEALEVADRVAVMNHGRIEQLDTPEAVYERPASPFVYQFLGTVNLFHGRVHEGAVRIGDAAFPMSADGIVTSTDSPDRASATAFVRPHEIDLSSQPNGFPAVRVRVLHVSAAGPIVRLHAERIDTNDAVEVELTKTRYRELKIKAGDEVWAHLKSLRVFGEDYSI
ncbi:sulfate/molybdate ABC transporter ATP-binding protein [Humisphaera borealis]|uniref:TOBE-like domain-containing protein n=1 Tax=Humisphaera borealis TaxID=2807512 RepID=A0A7M2WSE6_9BACT|nr:TOBE-like domain-containing protein [Humisphaera borealis]QOV88427.1 TOBE-like domain-containing protein [Humisphaera borealis]